MPNLTATQVKNAGPGRHSDGNGLILAVTSTGSRSWVHRITIDGKRRDIGLGGYPTVTLAQAREAAVANRAIARRGGNPLAHRDRAGEPTFEAAAARVHREHAPGWRNPKHAGQWISTLRTYVFPRIGTRPVSSITTTDVMAVLMTIWHEKPETARRVRQRISTIMRWAVAHGYRTDDPAAAALSAGSLAAFVPPPGTARLLIAADRDAAGRRAAAGLEARAKAQGLAAVVLTPAHGDFNDDLAALGPRALAARLTPFLGPGNEP